MSNVKVTYNGVDLTAHCDPADLQRLVSELEATATAVPYQCRRCGITLGHVKDGGLRLADGVDCAVEGKAAVIECPTCGAKRRWYDIRVRKHHP